MHIRSEPLSSHGETRIAGPLTLTNIVFGIIGITVGQQVHPWVIHTSSGWVMTITQFLFVILGAIVGCALTMRLRGLSLLDRVRLGVGYLFRRLSNQTRLRPPSTVLILGDTFTPIFGPDGTLLASNSEDEPMLIEAPFSEARNG